MNNTDPNPYTKVNSKGKTLYLVTEGDRIVGYMTAKARREYYDRKITKK